MYRQTQTQVNRLYIKRKIEQFVEMLYGTLLFIFFLAIYWGLSCLPEHVYKFTH